MATSGTFNFGVTTETIDIITEAYERCGKLADTLSANDLDSARRSLSYMFVEWSNRGPNLWAVDQLRFPLTSGVASITLPTNTVAILPDQAIVRTTNDDGTWTDLVISSIGRSEYQALPNKQQQAERPTQFYLERTINPVLYLWPVPNNSDREIYFYRMRMLQDVGNYTNTLDIANRWVEAAASGLAARLAVKWAPDRLAMLQPTADRQYEIAAAEDTEYVPLTIAPNIQGWGWR